MIPQDLPARRETGSYRGTAIPHPARYASRRRRTAQPSHFLRSLLGAAETTMRHRSTFRAGPLVLARNRPEKSLSEAALIARAFLCESVEDTSPAGKARLLPCRRYGQRGRLLDILAKRSSTHGLLDSDPAGPPVGIPRRGAGLRGRVDWHSPGARIGPDGRLKWR